MFICIPWHPNWPLERGKKGREGNWEKMKEREREEKKSICEIEKMIIRVKYNPGKQKYINIRVAAFVRLEEG